MKEIAINTEYWGEQGLPAIEDFDAGADYWLCENGTIVLADLGVVHTLTWQEKENVSRSWREELGWE